jgi:hypothetical protein
MVARLKLKEIDGRAPPGVNRSQLCAEKQPEKVRWFRPWGARLVKVLPETKC